MTNNHVLSLGGTWRMRTLPNGEWMEALVPGSLYSNLLRLGKIDDPFFGENEADALALSWNDIVLERDFSADAELLAYERVFLRFNGIDTLGTVTLNGTVLGETNNMHRVWEYEIKTLLWEGKNTLSVHIASPLRYIQEQQAAFPLWGVDSTVPGYAHLRKAHYMFGWDWGPKLPDLGIWRPVELIAVDAARLQDVHLRQQHRDGAVDLRVQVAAQAFGHDAPEAAVLITFPGKEDIEARFPLAADGSGQAELTIPNPALWWPNGYGEQPLYTVTVSLLSGVLVLDEKQMRIGLRTIEVSRDEDEWGQEFCFTVNGVKIFAMGGDYIPEDQILVRTSPEKTRHLLEQCARCHFNHVRVWGGGYYPENWFFDACDELGLLVWHDFMFACAVYRMEEDLVENIRQEVIENIRRIRHHASLALWCGNNEMEDGLLSWPVPKDGWVRGDYLFQYEELLPELCEEYDPDTFYWPSSPSSGGGFDFPQDPNRGDVHYWDVWHGMKPLTEFRRFFFRFCSEYGFMSVPCTKTVRAIADEKDWNLFSAALENHDKCDDGSKKLLYYMSQVVPYPYSFEGVIYATQLLQADAIRANVEHMRRHRGRCMGSTYWQVNDSNPVISWASIDYFGRWKALHYYTRRFYAPVLLSVNEEDPAALVFNISNERRQPAAGTVRWALRDAAANVLAVGEEPVAVAALFAQDCFSLDLSAHLSSTGEKRSRYLEYSLWENGQQVSYGTSLFVPPKHFAFTDPGICCTVAETHNAYLLTCTAAAYAKSVCLDLAVADCAFSDNWFDIHGTQAVDIRVEKASLSVPLALEEFRQQLTVFSCYDLFWRPRLPEGKDACGKFPGPRPAGTK